jgi:hypothetical protein
VPSPALLAALPPCGWELSSAHSCCSPGGRWCGLCARSDGAHVEYSDSRDDGSCEVVLIPSEAVAAASQKIRPRYELRALNPEEAARWYDQLDRTVQQLTLRNAVVGKSAGSGIAATPRTAARDATGTTQTAGNLLVQAQGMQHWRNAFGYAFEAALRLYATDADCPFDTSKALVDVTAGITLEEDTPAEADPPGAVTSPRPARLDCPLAVIDLSVLESIKNIELCEPHGVGDFVHVIIKSGGRVIRLRAADSSAATVAWHTSLQQLWREAGDNMLALQKLPASVLVAQFDASAAGAPDLGRTRTTVESERNAIVAGIFKHKIGSKVGNETDWVGNVAEHVQSVIEQAEHLMDEMALGLVQAGSRQDVSDWWVTTFYSTFMEMLRGFGARASSASGNSEETFSTNDAIAIIHWCKQFSERCVAMGLDTDVFETDPTKHGVYQALVDAHMPSYRGHLKKKNANLGWSKRYYALRDGSLRYFTSELMEYEHGCIPGEMITTAQVEAKSDSSGRTFSITWAGKHTELYAASSAEALLWVNRISEARDAAAAMERMAASRTCFEVESFDGHKEIGKAKVQTDCDLLFSNALLNLEGSTKGAQMMRFADAADLLVEQLEVRVERIPDYRTDVKEFFVLQYHTYISEKILRLASPELHEWQARGVSHFLFWARKFDRTIGSMLKEPLQQPLAAAEAWNDALPGFTTHQLPSYAGEVLQQYKSDRSWNKVWLVIEDMAARWFNDETAQEMVGSMQLTDEAAISNYTEDRNEYQIIIRTKQETLYLKVSGSETRVLLSCLNESVRPVLPGESVRGALDDDDNALQEAGRARVEEYRTHSHEELKAMIKQSFVTLTQEKVAQLSSEQPPQEFGLDHVLQLFGDMLDELVELVDVVLLSIDDDSGDADEIVNFNIVTRHKLLEECMKELCDPDKTVLDTGCNVVVGQDNVAELLSWVSDYSSRLRSLGVSFNWETEKKADDDGSESPADGQQTLKVDPLQFWCRNPMSEFVGAQAQVMSEWLTNIVKVEQSKQKDGKVATSLPMDLFKMIFQATRKAADAASQWLLVNTVMGVIVPQVRLWASNFEEELQKSDQNAEYFCACMNNMYECQRLYNEWTDELDARISKPEMMSDHDEDELKTGAVATAFRAVMNAATQRLNQVLLGSDEMAGHLDALVQSGRHHPKSAQVPDWPGEQMIQPMLSALRDRCAEVEGWLTPRMWKRAMDSFMVMAIDTYDQHLLKMARADPKYSSWGRRGHRRTPEELEAFVGEDIEQLHEFFASYYIREEGQTAVLTAQRVRTALQSTETISKLFGCELDYFEPAVQKAAIFDDFNENTVRCILEARKDIDATQRDGIVRRSKLAIDAIREGIHPTLPEKPAGGPTVGVIPSPAAAGEEESDGSAGADAAEEPVSTGPTPRVIAKHTHTAQEDEELSLTPGEWGLTMSVSVDRLHSICYFRPPLSAHYLSFGFALPRNHC